MKFQIREKYHKIAITIIVYLYFYIEIQKKAKL